MGDKSPIILTERKKRRMAAKEKEEMKARFQWAIDSEQSVDAVETLVSGDNNNNNNKRVPIYGPGYL